jgi:hypothetical protein
LVPGGARGLQNRCEALNRLGWVRLPSTPVKNSGTFARAGIFYSIRSGLLANSHGLCHNLLRTQIQVHSTTGAIVSALDKEGNEHGQSY